MTTTTTVEDVLKTGTREGKGGGGGQRAEAEAEKSRLLNYPSPQLSRSVSSPPAHFVFHSRTFSSYLPLFSLLFFRPAASFPYPPPPSTSFFCYGSWSISSRRAPTFPLSLASRDKIRTVVNIAFEHSSPHFSALYRLTLVPSINCNI